jgi:cell division protein FtsQ
MVPSNGTDLQLQFGQEDFLARWRNYETHIAQWRQQYPKLAAVDLRYEHEVVLKMTPDVAAAAATSGTDRPALTRPVNAKPPTRDNRPRTRNERTKAGHGRKGTPQGLKPKSSSAPYGTAKAAPLQNSLGGAR